MLQARQSTGPGRNTTVNAATFQIISIEEDPYIPVPVSVPNRQLRRFFWLKLD
jgi:hypothetical protein